jgi:lysophospholipase L1-like esterase
VLLPLGTLAWRIAQSAQLARYSTAFQQAPSNPAVRMLIVGDSTAVGTGASAPARSLAGLLAQGHPRLLIDNRARDGATLADVPAQIDSAGRYDLALVQAGGNDVIRLRDLDAVRRDLERVIALARAHADRVLIMPAGNVGNASMLFPPLSWWMTVRSRALHRHVREVAAQSGAVYVDLFEEREDDPFVQRPGLYAVDGLHPSDAGYALWLQQLRRQTAVERLLAPAGQTSGP